MNKYRLSVDKTVNSIDTVEIETSLSEKELDALLDKIEKTDNPTTEDYIKKLQKQGIKINSIIPGSVIYYRKAEVTEMEKVEEPTVFEFLTELKQQVTDEEFKTILAATDADIKFNRVSFNKRTTPKQYITICKACASVVLR
ncbi:MAG: hypothetical protein ACLSTJ_07930 [Clostridium neonatale]